MKNIIGEIEVNTTIKELTFYKTQISNLKDQLHRRNTLIKKLREEIRNLKNELEHKEVFGDKL